MSYPLIATVYNQTNLIGNTTVLSQDQLNIEHNALDFFNIGTNTDFSLAIQTGYKVEIRIVEGGLTVATYYAGEYNEINNAFGPSNSTLASLKFVVDTDAANPVVATVYNQINLQGTSTPLYLSNLNKFFTNTVFSIGSGVDESHPFSMVVNPNFKIDLYFDGTSLQNIVESFERGTYNNISNSYSGPGYMVNFQNLRVSPSIYTPPLNSYKRSKLNLFSPNNALHFQINQKTSSTQIDFPTDLVFADNSRNISDVLDYLQRIVTVESDIDALEVRTSVIEADIDLLEGRASVNEADIDLLEDRASVNEADLGVLKTRADSNAARLLVDDSELSALEAYVDALEGRASVNEADIDALEGRASVNEADIDVLEVRADSNAARLLVDKSELSALEGYVDALEGRASVNEADIDALEGRASVNEADLGVLKTRADSNAARLLVDSSELSALEGYVDALEGRASVTEVDIVTLENSFTVYEADVVDVKETLYAISDGNIESMLSSLHQIQDSFTNNTNMAEDMVELNVRLTELESVLQELTE